MFSSISIKTVVLSLVLVIFVHDVSPISETTVTACAVGGGIACSALTGYGIHLLARHNGCSNTSTWLLTGLGSAAAGFAAGALIHNIMSKYTPTGRFAYAQGVIASLHANKLIARAGDNQDAVVARIISIYGTSWPLVAARESLMRNSINLGSASTELDLAYNEAIQAPDNYPFIIQGYHGLRASIPAIYNNIELLLQIITKHEKYDLQVGLFEKHMAQMRKQQHEKTLQSDKLSHDSWENHKERDYKRKENDKDRHLVAGRPTAKLNFTMGGR